MDSRDEDTIKESKNFINNVKLPHFDQFHKEKES